ncbi:WYL domain-containing protein [Stomatohabitans albus]|uniref:helix-turn-helix transcriptional regulator n=1 Tax=Stomatohabitans albus TaxID=3110766 RepID=UPI00300C3CE5
MGRPRAYIHQANSVVIARTPAELNGFIDHVERAGKPITPVAPTVAISPLEPGGLAALLHDDGVDIAGTYAIQPHVTDPQLDWQEKKAVGLGAIRAAINQAIDEQRQVELHYFATSHHGAATIRVIDPWSLTGNLLTGWCHLRHDERSFALERIGTAVLLRTPIANRPTSS